MFDFGDNSSIIVNGYDGDIDFSDEKFCDKCGTSLSEFLRTGVVGCSVCYKTFEEEIRVQILQKHGTINHVGKVSLKHTSKLKTKELIAELEAQKEKAAEEENYILAEDLKNKIEKLKGEL